MAGTLLYFPSYTSTMGKIKPFERASRWIERKCRPLFNILHRKGITPNHLTFSQILLWPITIYCFYLGQVYTAFAFATLTMLIDIIDGPFARATKQATDAGYYIDHMTDMGSNIVVIIGLILLLPELTTVGVLLILATIGVYLTDAMTKAQIFGSPRVYTFIAYPLGLIGLGLWICFIQSAVITLWNGYTILRGKR
jgi:phosphatidylglycerophosphate synthase